MIAFVLLCTISGFVARTSPHLVLEEDFLALETGAGSISAQWPAGSLSIWLWNEQREWRLWPPGLPVRERQ